MKKNAKIGLLVAAMTFGGSTLFAQVSVGINISARIAPPALPVYTQPACPGEGYLWTPGYWAYNDAGGYYWVPGVWVRPPRVGVLWTPAYWGFVDGIYSFHSGYWGPHIGFYGGINYGYGYGGSGFYGGRWEGGSYRYNTAVTNVNTTVIHNTYVNKTVINNNVVNNRTSFNGQGGVNVQPRAEELRAMHEEHIQPTASQLSHEQTAGRNRSQFANVNHGARPGQMNMNGNNGRQMNINNQMRNNRLANMDRPPQQRFANINRPMHAPRPHNEQPHPRPHGDPHRAEHVRRG
jgi:hypothetical protein